MNTLLAPVAIPTLTRDDQSLLMPPLLFAGRRGSSVRSNQRISASTPTSIAYGRVGTLTVFHRQHWSRSCRKRLAAGRVFRPSGKRKTARPPGSRSRIAFSTKAKARSYCPANVEKSRRKRSRSRGSNRLTLRYGGFEMMPSNVGVSGSRRASAATYSNSGGAEAGRRSRSKSMPTSLFASGDSRAAASKRTPSPQPRSRIRLRFPRRLAIALAV